MKAEVLRKLMTEEERDRTYLKLCELIDEINRCKESPLAMSLSIDVLLHAAVGGKKENALEYLDTMAEKIRKNKMKIWK